MRAPGSRFSASVGKVVAMRVEVPAISRGVMVSFCPALSCTGMRFFSRPVRIFGPCRSPRMQIGLPSSLRDLAHHLDQLELFRMGAVGKVKPGHIEAGADQLAENRFVITGRAQGGDNLGPAALARREGYRLVPSG